MLARAAVAAGVDGIFLEVHDNPKEAKSDGANALESTKLRDVLNCIVFRSIAGSQLNISWRSAAWASWIASQTMLRKLYMLISCLFRSRVCLSSD